MAIEIFLTEGPNVEGLPEGRVPLYVGHRYRGNDNTWYVVEGRKTGMPKTYQLHVGNNGSFSVADVVRFEWDASQTSLIFKLDGREGQLLMLNTRSNARYTYGSIDEPVGTVYNFFGDGKTDMRPDGCEEYYRKE